MGYTPFSQRNEFYHKLVFSKMYKRNILNIQLFSEREPEGIIGSTGEQNCSESHPVKGSSTDRSQSPKSRKYRKMEHFSRFCRYPRRTPEATTARRATTPKKQFQALRFACIRRNFFDEKASTGPSSNPLREYSPGHLNDQVVMGCHVGKNRKGRQRLAPGHYFIGFEKQ